MKNSFIAGVMGGGSVDRETTQNAYQLGSLIATRGWILLNFKIQGMFDRYLKEGRLFVVRTPEAVIDQIDVLFPKTEGTG